MALPDSSEARVQEGSYVNTINLPIQHKCYDILIVTVTILVSYICPSLTHKILEHGN